MHSRLAGNLDLALENLSPQELAQRCETIFCCLPHTASAAVTPELLGAGCKVVDLSADYRLRDVATFEKWYDVAHPDPARVPTTVYGLPELFRDEIRDASLVANPGCYPTSAILPLAPLLKASLIDGDDLIVNAASGVSGAGRSPKLGTLYCEVNESFAAYGVGAHRHTPEIAQILELAAGRAVNPIFTPHLAPMERGILATIYAKPVAGGGEASAREALKQAYEAEPFVQVTEALPRTSDVARTNSCRIAVREVNGRLILLSAIDNLVKGASGAAVQNFNLMHGFDETTALIV